MEETIDVIVKLVALSRLPPLRPVITRALRLVAVVKGE
jgi:hypothetical protein